MYIYYIYICIYRCVYIYVYIDVYIYICLLGVGVEGTCKATKIISREKLFHCQKIHFTPTIIVTAKMKGWVGFPITA